MINAPAVLMNLPSPNGFFGISDSGKLNSTASLDGFFVERSGSPAAVASGSSLENDMTREKRGLVVALLPLPLPFVKEVAEREKWRAREERRVDARACMGVVVLEGIYCGTDQEPFGVPLTPLRPGGEHRVGMQFRNIS